MEGLERWEGKEGRKDMKQVGEKAGRLKIEGEREKGSEKSTQGKK